MASTRLEDLTPDTRERAQVFLQAAKAAGFDLAVASTLRSCADQGTSTVPVDVQGMKIKRAPGCRSWHVWGRAFDVVLRNSPTPERYAELGALGKSLGLEWGGDFVSNPDPIHFQYPGGLSIKTLCPDPNDCEEALKRAGLPVPTPSPELVVKPSSNGLVLVVGVALGWAAVAWWRKLRK